MTEAWGTLSRCQKLYPALKAFHPRGAQPWWWSPYIVLWCFCGDFRTSLAVSNCLFIVFFYSYVFCCPSPVLFGLLLPVTLSVDSFLSMLLSFFLKLVLLHPVLFSLMHCGLSTFKTYIYIYIWRFFFIFWFQTKTSYYIYILSMSQLCIEI